MDAPSGDRSSPRSRQQLQGPRPPRLAVSKDSHKVRKPPVAPQRHQHQHQHRQQHHHQQQQARQPVIIYDASPKVIHTKPGDFMALVQRLTGPGSSASQSQQVQLDAAAGGYAGPSASAAPSEPQQQPATDMDLEPREFLLSPTAALSPAARLAAIERSVRPLPPAPAPPSYPYPYPYYGAASAADDELFLPASADMDGGLAAALGPTAAGRPGILSPAALPPAASTGLFSPLPFDPSCLSWLSELSPFLPSAGTRAEQQHLHHAAPFAPSPRSSSGGLLLSTPTMPSPATVSVLEFFSNTNFPDL